jgi:hypothetical protein
MEAEMTNDRDSGRPEKPYPDEQESGHASNPFGGIVDPLAKLGIDTARDIATAVQSTRAAGRDIWRLVNLANRIPGRDAGAGRDVVASSMGYMPETTAKNVIDFTDDEDDEDDDDEDTEDTDRAGGALEKHGATARQGTVEVVEPSKAAGPGIVGGLRRAAETALNPAAVLGAAVSPVRRVVSSPERGAPAQSAQGRYRHQAEGSRRRADCQIAATRQRADPPASGVRQYPRATHAR